MFVRIWRTRIDPQRAADYDRFAGSTSLSMFSAQPGFVGVIFAGAGADRAVITLWRDRHSVEALRESDSYKRTVAELEATGILAAGSSVEVLEVMSPLHIDLSEIVRGGLLSDGEEDVRRREARDHPFAGQRHTAAALPNRLQSVKSSYDAVAAEYWRGSRSTAPCWTRSPPARRGSYAISAAGRGMWRTTCISAGLLSWESISRPR